MTNFVDPTQTDLSNVVMSQVTQWQSLVRKEAVYAVTFNSGIRYSSVVKDHLVAAFEWNLFQFKFENIKCMVVTGNDVDSILFLKCGAHSFHALQLSLFVKDSNRMWGAHNSSPWEERN